jgi:hypothetical protein
MPCRGAKEEASRRLPDNFTVAANGKTLCEEDSENVGSDGDVGAQEMKKAPAGAFFAIKLNR